MKLTLLCTTVLAFPHGGIPAVNRQMIRQLMARAEHAKHPLELDVWSLHDAPLAPAEVARAVGLSRAIHSFRGFSGNKLAMIADAVAHRGKPPDCILITHLGISPIARLIRRPHTEVTQFLHGTECWRALPFRVRWGFQAAGRILSNSAFTHRRFVEENPRYRNLPHEVCWLGLPEDHRAEGIAELPSQDGNQTVLIVGRIVQGEKYKGHADLLAVWPEIRRRFPRACLDIAGDGDGLSALRHAAREQSLCASGAVRFWGQLSDSELVERYRQCAIFAMPSKGEGFGLVYLEAMFFGKPCIASCDDAASEVVLDGVTGRVVPYADRAALLDVLTDLLTDPVQSKKLGQAGRARVLSHFLERQFGQRLWSALALPGDAPHVPSVEVL
jgi:glycosyltransferase involved in cell wall biosynthesis